MNPKMVWSIVLIVLGVLFILGGVNGCYETSIFGKEIESSGKLINKYGGKIGREIFDVEHYRGLILKEKIKYFLFLLLGVAGAVSGTLMLKKSDFRIPVNEDFEDDFEKESSDDGKWRF
jgi:hypothetical protein